MNSCSVKNKIYHNEEVYLMKMKVAEEQNRQEVGQQQLHNVRITSIFLRAFV